MKHRMKAIESLKSKTHTTVADIIGTLPYMPDEYVRSGFVSDKTDAFAFGIILIELLSDCSGRGAREMVDCDMDDSYEPVHEGVGCEGIEKGGLCG